MKNSKIDSGKEFDFGRTASAYAEYRDIYPTELYDRLRSLGVSADGSAWLDLGTGTGVLPKNLYNEKCDITAVDISPEQIAAACKDAKKFGRRVKFISAPAENTGLPDKAFDTITAAQCFWYFDREKMRSEIERMLKPGGKFIKVFMNWDFDDEIAAESIALVEKYNHAWSSGRNADADMYDDLFPGRVTQEFYADIPFTRRSWHGRMIACRGTLASMDGETFEKWESAHREMLKKYPDSFTVGHRVYLSYFKL